MKISIITPSLNQGKFIEEAIQSVINQVGNFELEYIIMDGGSDDNTIDVIKKYDKLLIKFKPRCLKLDFKWFSEKDNGQSHAINKGFKIATGEVVNWLCSDDVLENGALQKVADYFKNNEEANIVFGDAVAVKEDSKRQAKLEGKDFSYEDLIRRWDRAYHKFYIAEPSVFFRKFLLDELGYLNEKNHLSMDYELWLKFRSKYFFYYTPSVLSYVRIHSGSKSIKNAKKQFKESISLSKQYWQGNYIEYFFSYYFYYFLKYPAWRILKLFRMI